MGLSSLELWPNLTIADLLDLLIEERESQGKSTRETLRYQTAGIRAALGHLHPAALTSDDLLGYRKERLSGVNPKTGRKLSPATWNREMDELRCAYLLGAQRTRRHTDGRAYVLVRLEERPPDFCKIEGAKRYRKVYLSPDDVERLLEELPPHLRGIFEFLSLSGWRSGAARELRWGQIDRERRVIRPGRQRAKNKRPSPCLITTAVEELLRRQWIAYLERHGKKAPADWKTHFVFSRPDGRPLGEWRTAWQGALRRSGLDQRDPKPCPHDLRHSARKNLRQAGVAEVLIQELLGHSSTEVSRGYDPIGEDDFQAVTRVLDEFQKRQAAARPTEPPAAREARGGRKPKIDDGKLQVVLDALRRVRAGSVRELSDALPAWQVYRLRQALSELEARGQATRTMERSERGGSRDVWRPAGAPGPRVSPSELEKPEDLPEDEGRREQA